MAQGQLTNYMSTFFNERQKPSAITPRTVRKALSIADERPLMKLASLSPMKQPCQPVIHGAHSGLPENGTQRKQSSIYY